MISHKIRNYMLFLGIIALALLAFTISADDSEARLCVWDGGDAASALASDPDNWDTDTAPVAGDDILFDGLHLVNASADDPCTWDLSTNSFGNFTIAAGYSGTITQSSDMYISGYSQAGGTFIPINNKNIYGSGNWIRTGGTWNVFLGNVHFIDNVTNPMGGFSFYTLNIHEGTTFQSSGIHNIRVYLQIDGTLNNTGTIQIDWLSSGTSCIRGNGDINNTGIIRFKVNSLLFQINYSKPLGNVEFINYNAADCKVTFLSDINTGTLSLVSGDSYDYTLDLNGHSLTASSITVGTRGILQCGEGTITTGALTSTSGTIIEETATWVFTGTGNLKLKAGDYLYNAQFNGATTIFQNTLIWNALSISDLATITDGVGTFRFNVTSAVEDHTLLGAWDFPIYFDGTPDRLNLTVEETMGGVVYFQNETTLLWTGGSMTLVPDGWCDVVLLAWDEPTGNLYGALHFNGDAEFNATVDPGRYVLWNGTSVNGGVSGEDGYFVGDLYAVSTLTFTINPCPRFVTTPDVLDYYGGRYYYNADTNEELNGIAQTYTLVCNFDSQIVVVDSGEVQGDVSDALQHNYSLLVQDALGGYAYLNWTVEISLLQWNLRATIVSEENGWLKVKYDFEFASNKSLLTNVAWNFGDGNGSKDLSPVHAYDRAGVYLVTLIMFDEFGRSGVTTVEITVGDPTADQGEAYLNYWLNERLAGAAAIVLISVLLAALYVYVADKEWGGAHRLFPVAVIALGFIIALLVYGGN
jgi:hypothetical protein